MTVTLLLIYVLSLLSPAITGFGTHVSSYGVSIGLSSIVSAYMSSVHMLGNTGFKVLMGVLCDRLWPKRAASLILGCMAVGFVLLAMCSAQAMAGVVIGSCLIGGCYSVGAVALPNIIRRVYGEEDFAVVYARANVLCHIGTALSYSINGFAYDYFQSYLPSVWCCCILSLVCIGIVFRIYHRKENATN